MDAYPNGRGKRFKPASVRVRISVHLRLRDGMVYMLVLETSAERIVGSNPTGATESRKVGVLTRFEPGDD